MNLNISSNYNHLIIHSYSIQHKALNFLQNKFMVWIFKFYYLLIFEFYYFWCIRQLITFIYFHQKQRNCIYPFFEIIKYMFFQNLKDINFKYFLISFNVFIHKNHLKYSYFQFYYTLDFIFFEFENFPFITKIIFFFIHMHGQKLNDDHFLYLNHSLFIVFG